MKEEKNNNLNDQQKKMVNVIKFINFLKKQKQKTNDEINNLTEEQKKESVKLPSINEFCRDYNIVGNEHLFYDYLMSYYLYLQDNKKYDYDINGMFFDSDENDEYFFENEKKKYNKLINKLILEIDKGFPKNIYFMELLKNNTLPYYEEFKNRILNIFWDFTDEIGFMLDGVHKKIICPGNEEFRK